MFFYIHSGEGEGPRPLGPFRTPCRVGKHLDKFMWELGRALRLVALTPLKLALLEAQVLLKL